MKPAGAREVFAFAAIALVGVIVQIALMGAYDLIARPLWFDECLTWLLATDESFVHEMHALAGGADTNMPGLYVILRPMQWAGVVTPEGLRWCSIGWTVAAMTFLYACVRSFARREVAVAGGLMLWSHPLVMAHAFEARFYAPLLCAAAAVEWALAARSRVGLAAGAIVLCGVHYFGVIVLMLMVAVVVTRQRTWRQIWPAGAGVVVTVGCLPFYFGQRGSFAVTDWMEGVGIASLGSFAREIFPVALMLLAGIAVGVTIVLRRARLAAGPLPASGAGERMPIALLSLFAMPVVLTAISFVAQPVLMGRYAIVVALALAAAACWVMRDASRWLVVAVSVALIGLSCWNLHRLRQFQMMAAARVVVIADGIESVPAAPAVFESGFDALPVHVAGVERVRMLEAPLDGRESSHKADVVRAQMKNVTRWYPQRAPTWISPDDALKERALIYVPWEEFSPTSLPAGYVVTPINPLVYLIEKRD